MKDDLGPGWWQYEHWSSWFPFPEDHRRQDGATDRCEEVANCNFCYNYCYYLGRITHLQWQCWCVALDILPDTEKPIRTRNDKSGAIFVKLWQAHFFLCLFCLKYQLNCKYFYFTRTEHNNEINILISHFYNDVLNLAGPGLSCTCWWPTPTHWPFCLPSSPICIRTPRWRQLLHQPCTDGSIYFTWILNCLD